MSEQGNACQGIESKGFQNIPINSTSIQMTDINSHSPSSPKSFKNGDVLVTLPPINKHCAWFTPSTFKPEHVPEELMATKLVLTVEDYVASLQLLVNDFRFNLYIIFYKRILIFWIALGFMILISLLFSGAKGLALFAGGVLWLVINACGIFVSMWMKTKLFRMLETCVAKVNEILSKSNILLGVDDSGNISCHKVKLLFIYFDVKNCIKYLQEMLENEQTIQDMPNAYRPQLPPISLSRNDIDASDIIITGSATPTRVSQKEKFAEKLLLRYSQRWVKNYTRSRIDLNTPLHADASVEPSPALPPRHCATTRCLCQYIEEHLRFKTATGCSITELFM